MKNFGNIANIKGWFNSVKQTVIIYMGRSAIVPLNKFVKDYEEKVSFMKRFLITKEQQFQICFKSVGEQTLDNRNSFHSCTVKSNMA